MRKYFSFVSNNSSLAMEAVKWIFSMIALCLFCGVAGVILGTVLSNFVFILKIIIILIGGLLAAIALCAIKDFIKISVLYFKKRSQKEGE